MGRKNTTLVVGVVALWAGLTGAALAGDHAERGNSNAKRIILSDQGSFAFGGKVITSSSGDTFHGDHGYVQYQIPVNPRKLPLVMWHGGGQFSKTWETTPDGRDGYQNIFLRRNFATYIIDQPRRGRAGRSTEGATILPPFGGGVLGETTYVPEESSIFGIFRIGTWTPPNPPDYFPGVQFPRSAEALDQYFRQITPNTGPVDFEGAAVPEAPDAVAKLFKKTGPAILLTHSASGFVGWLTAIKSPNVKAIVAYEPVRFVFPEGQVPQTGPIFTSQAVPLSDFNKLTKVPIQIVYGDNLDKHPIWVQASADVLKFAKAVNDAGGNVEVLFLPAAGLRGNTHFPFSDLNNEKVADLLSKWLSRKGLDGYPKSEHH